MHRELLGWINRVAILGYHDKTTNGRNCKSQTTLDSRLFRSVDVLALHFVQQRPARERPLRSLDVRTGRVRRIGDRRVRLEPPLEPRLTQLYTLVEAGSAEEGWVGLGANESNLKAGMEASRDIGGRVSLSKP